jgi:DNA invertase Pin-like site-specific DNA recombinase
VIPLSLGETLGYIRVSTEQQTGEHKTSLIDQKRLITNLAAKLGRALNPGAIFEDAGISGATAEGRPAFMAMVGYCQSNPRTPSTQGVIIVLNDSRFGRFDDPEEATHWRYLLKRLGWHVRFCESDDVQDPFARGVIRYIGSAQASEYRANLKRTAKRSARSTAERGLWQQEAPLGYRRLAIRLDGTSRVLAVGQRKSDDEVSRLTPGPEHEQEAIRWMFEMYGKGGTSLGALSREMQTKFPLRRWSTSTVGATLRNPAYAGDVVWCRRVTDSAERLLRTVRDQSEWVIVRDAHPALVPRELYESVQQRMAANKRQTTATQGGYPLTGLIRCAQCGEHFSGGGGRKGPPGDIDRYRFYRDSGAGKRVPVCKPPVTTLRKRWLEEQVVSAVAKMVADPRTQAIIRQEVQRLMSSAAHSGKARRIELEREKHRLTDQRQRLVDAIASGVLSEGEAARSLAELRGRIFFKDSEIERERFADRSRGSGTEEIERMVELAQDFPTQVKRLHGNALRELIRPWIADAVVDKEQRSLILTLWRIPEAVKVFHLSTSPEPG